MVGAIAVDLRPPDDLLGLQVDRDDVGEARPREIDDATVRRGEAVVDVLVVPLADQLADQVEERGGDRVGVDLGDPLLGVGDDVDPFEPLERARVDQVGGAGPVVADDEDVALAALLGVDGGRNERADQRDRNDRQYRT